MSKKEIEINKNLQDNKYVIQAYSRRQQEYAKANAAGNIMLMDKLRILPVYVPELDEYYPSPGSLSEGIYYKEDPNKSLGYSKGILPEAKVYISVNSQPRESVVGTFPKLSINQPAFLSSSYTVIKITNPVFDDGHADLFKTISSVSEPFEHTYMEYHSYVKALIEVLYLCKKYLSAFDGNNGSFHQISIYAPSTVRCSVQMCQSLYNGVRHNVNRDDDSLRLFIKAFLKHMKTDDYLLKVGKNNLTLVEHLVSLFRQFSNIRFISVFPEGTGYQLDNLRRGSNIFCTRLIEDKIKKMFLDGWFTNEDNMKSVLQFGDYFSAVGYYNTDYHRGKWLIKYEEALEQQKHSKY